MTGQLLIQSRDGREVIPWDTEANSGGDLDPVYAKTAFAEKMSHGFFAFAETVTEEGTTREQIRSGGFDPETQSKVVMTPAIAGGSR